MFPPDRPWRPQLEWRTPAGRTLRRFIESLPLGGQFEITVFGSAPLQLALAPRFLSADVDFFSQDDFRKIIRAVKLGQGQRRVYLEQCAETAFVASPTWRERAYDLSVRNVTLVFPHPIDILVSKLPRINGVCEDSVVKTETELN